MASKKLKIWVTQLMTNARFWVLSTGLVLAVVMAGFVQLFVPSQGLQLIKVGQLYGVVSLFLLWLALLATPLTKNFPNMPLKDNYLHARRAIGVLAFTYAALHGGLTFFGQLGGFSGIKYYSPRYEVSILLGAFALIVLFFMTITSLDKAVKLMGFKRWKMLHRLVYFAGIAAIAHSVTIGSHFDSPNIVSIFSLIGLVVLVWLEMKRIIVANKKGLKK